MKLKYGCALLIALSMVLPLAAQTMKIVPSVPQVALGKSIQFYISSSGLGETAIAWTATSGTISSSGLYTAPATMPANLPMITATAVSQPTVTATVWVNLLTPGPTITSVSPNPLTANSTLNVTVNGSGFQAGATVHISWGQYSNIQMSTVGPVTSNSITGNTYLGNATSATITVFNPGTTASNAIVVPVVAAVPSFALNVVGGSGTGSYPVGTVVNITANAPPAGQVFLNWTGPVANPNSATTTVTMPGQGTTVTAVFGVPVSHYALTVVNGTGSGSYTAGTVVNIAANAAPAGQAFLNWTGAAVANANNAATTFTMPAAPATVTANYFVIPTPIPTSISLPVVPIGIFSFQINGSGFLANSTVTLGGSALTTHYVSANQLNVSGFVSQGGMSNIVVNNLGVMSQPLAVQVGPTNPQVTPQAARRFLQQAAFGPTSAEAANVQTLGFQAWLTQQFAQPKTSNYNGLGNQGGMGARFLNNAVNQPDQLRQRVAFALSQIFVISQNKVIWNFDQKIYQEMLMTDAFKNFRTILEDVTLSPGMGYYLDMANNAKGNAAGTVLPNENYAREVMQLFTIGTSMLNQDGTKQLNNGAPIPTYSQTDIAQFAKVYTGWTFPNQYGYAPIFGSYIYSGGGPMQAVQSFHDVSPKTLLTYTPLPNTNPPFSLPPNNSAYADLTGALDNLFYHPNVAPFISRQLIQHLVKSNPSPAYVSRVAAVFNDNGQGVRGDMVAVVTAILLDAEARANDVAGNTQPTDGHLQEPVVFLAAMLRAFNAYVDDTNYYGSELVQLSQDIYDAPSVFNYFSPGYQVTVQPGQPTVGGPEFQIYNSYTSVYRDNLMSDRNGQGLFNSWGSNIQSYGPGTVVDITPFVNLASTPVTLVNALDLTLTCGNMPQGLKDILVAAVQQEQMGALRQAQTAIYLLLSSGYYNVWN